MVTCSPLVGIRLALPASGPLATPAHEIAAAGQTGEGDRVAAVSGGQKLVVSAEDDAHSIDREALDPWAITAQAASSLDPWPRPGRLPADVRTIQHGIWIITFQRPFKYIPTSIK